MKLLIYIGLILVGFSSCKQSALVLKESEIPDGVFYSEDQMKPYSGICIVYYPGTRQLKEELTYADGLLNGRVASYYKDGQLKRLGRFVKGEMDGKWEGWFGNGQKQYIAHYRNDKLDGDYQEWFENGEIKEKGRFTQNVRTGSWERSPENGISIIK
ncbi:MAG: hypothetical protein JW801_06360 [Bacteroidales bacterium]|nr:hypothetical protein [Bacteroidales bacterium]